MADEGASPKPPRAGKHDEKNHRPSEESVSYFPPNADTSKKTGSRPDTARNTEASIPKTPRRGNGNAKPRPGIPDLLSPIIISPGDFSSPAVSEGSGSFDTPDSNRGLDASTPLTEPSPFEYRDETKVAFSGSPRPRDRNGRFMRVNPTQPLVVRPSEGTQLDKGNSSPCRNLFDTETQQQGPAVPRQGGHKIKSIFRKNDLELMIPCDVWNRYQDKSSKCVASIQRGDRRGQRCTYEPRVFKDIKGRPNAEGVLEKAYASLKTLKANFDEGAYNDIPNKIADFGSRAFCARHHIMHTAKLRQIVHLLETDEQHTRPLDVVKFSDWIAAISTGIKVEDSRSQATDRSTNPSTRLQSLDHTDSIALGPFRKWQPVRTSKMPVTECLLETIWPMLLPSEKEYGYIYAFEHYSNRSYVKIGYTIDLARRLDQWNRRCCRTHVYERQGTPIRIPHVSRVEKLIHRELKEVRRKTECSKCDKEHDEWFEISIENAIKVIKRWEEWILQAPYEPGFNERWSLKPAFQKRLAEFCAPIDLHVSLDQEAETLVIKKEAVNMATNSILNAEPENLSSGKIEEWSQALGISQWLDMIRLIARLAIQLFIIYIS